MNGTVYWIWLSLACSPDTSTFPKLVERFHTAEAVYSAPLKEISECIGYKTSDRTNFMERDLTAATEIYDFCVKYGVGMLTYGDAGYPSSLKSIPTPPAVLYYRGRLPDFESCFCIGAVGTRSLSDYGRKNAFRICYDLATAGATVVSGMAIGIDGVALAAALAAGKPVVAVLGCGIDICYPKQHLTLAREIVKEGCVITEYPPHTPPLKHNFPKRNRIISGLSEATLVFEGRERSGAVITARYAKDQGRAVYALPGSVGLPNSEASSVLLRNGAKTFTSADDIVADFQDSHPGRLNPFLMKQTCPVDLMETLRLYRVSALCPGDDVFTPPAPRRTRRESDSEVDASRTARTRTKVDEPAEASDSRDTADTAPPPSFDANALRIYKKIPASGDCTVDSLVDDELSMREVSRALFKLELGSFVVRLPGERVMRKTK